VSDVREPDPVLDCIDCGGRASLVSEAPELGWAPGDVAVYRCADCLDRWDVVVDEAE
jgi:hypothetical protein